MAYNEFDDNENVEGKGLTFDFKGFLFKALNLWKLVLFCIGASLIIAYLINVRKPNVYKLDSLISIENDQNPFFTANTSISFNWGGVSGKVGKVITTLKTRSHNEKVVDSLQFYLNYLVQGKYNMIDIYKRAPFYVELDKGKGQILGKPIGLRFINDNDNQFQYFSTPIDKFIFNSDMHRIIYGLDFIINKETIISFTGQTNISGYNYNEKQQSVFFKNNMEKEIRKNLLNSKNKSIQQNYSFYLKKTFAISNTIVFSTNLYFLNDNGNSFLTDTLFSYPDKRIIIRTENSDNQQFSVNSHLDYEHSFSKSLKLETGYQLYFRNISGNSYSNDIYSLLSYSDLRNSLYGTFDYETGKYGFEAGIRVEDCHISIDDTSHNNYLKLLPQLSVVYKPRLHHTLRFVYNKKLKYPSLYYLNPYQFYSPDSLSFNSGNPYLSPETIHRVTFKYIYKNRSINISASLSYGIINDLIITDYNYNNNSFGSKYQNIGKVNKLGLNVNAYFILFNFIEMETYLYLNYNDFKNNSIHNGLSYMGGLSTYMPLPWDIDFDFTFLLGTKDVYYNGYSTENFLIDDFSLSKDILGGNGTIGISVWEPFLRNISNEKIWGNDFNENSSSETINNTAFLLEFTYSLSKGKEVKKVKKELQMENNHKDVK